MNTVAVTIRLDGRARSFTCEARESLADALRERCGVRGVHLGCEHGICGACTVWVDGRSARSCLMLAAQADGAEITTVESLARGELHPLQMSFSRHHALQCGYCTPGMLMTALEVVRDAADELDEPAVREALSGNLCRCTGYQSIVDAVLDYARSESAPAPPPATTDEEHR